MQHILFTETEALAPPPIVWKHEQPENGVQGRLATGLYCSQEMKVKWGLHSFSQFTTASYRPLEQGKESACSHQRHTLLYYSFWSPVFQAWPFRAWWEPGAQGQTGVSCDQRVWRCLQCPLGIFSPLPHCPAVCTCCKAFKNAFRDLLIRCLVVRASHSAQRA